MHCSNRENRTLKSCRRVSSNHRQAPKRTLCENSRGFQQPRKADQKSAASGKRQRTNSEIPVVGNRLLGKRVVVEGTGRGGVKHNHGLTKDSRIEGF